MSKFLSILIPALLISFFGNTQISVTPKAVVESDDSKTIFVYRQSDEDHLDDLTKVIADNWKYNTIELMSLDEFKNYETNVNDLFFIINYTYATTNYTYFGGEPAMVHSNYVDFYLALFQKMENGDSLLSQSSLSVSGPTIGDVCKTNKKPEEIITNQYTSSTVFSWNFAYLGTILNTVSTKLQDGADYKFVENNANLNPLKTKKLYVSDAVNIEQNLLNGKEKTVDFQKDIDKSYDYEFEIVTTKKINDLVISGEGGYLFMFQKVGHGKELIVIDLSKMEIIYQKMVSRKYNFDKSDISDLNKIISKLTP